MEKERWGGERVKERERERASEREIHVRTYACRKYQPCYVVQIFKFNCQRYGLVTVYASSLKKKRERMIFYTISSHPSILP